MPVSTMPFVQDFLQVAFQLGNEPKVGLILKSMQSTQRV
ncbi:hypothetical protein BLL52_3477 [Rhodoferax antarcticus ANT.BR]|uniref:Uncharacterized protein n=1 Tax=Rhodoferax antarcticus ANT.BR TaxID=1111071 RepID=A0A1Q8YBI5_9BURK|nr:hypothetical protein BLL52_3477 [Rhodoferax antarcticus ANT.BR]